MLPAFLLLALPAPRPAAPDPDSWRELVELTCLDCHSGERTEGGVDLAAALAEPALHRDLWERAYTQVQAAAMPPEEPLDGEERQEWITGALEATAGSHGPAVTPRRLTRSQLGRVLRDLLQVEVPVDRFLARDASAEGFDTTGDVLFVTPLSFENLFELVDVAIREGRAAGQAPVFSAESSVEERLAAFMERAFRRPPGPGERASRLGLLEELRLEGQDEEAALDAALRATLLSPSFLYRNEVSSPGDGFDLAARLSLFLWGTIPDSELLAMARDGRLEQEGALAEVLERMLDDQRSRWLAEDFALQWLGVSELGDVTPDIRRFRPFKEDLRSAMRAEVISFFNSLVEENGSLLECLDSETVHVNARLAQHYGIEGVDGGRVRPVPRGEHLERGGVLGMAAVHTITSTPLRTSPVNRGQWVLERLLRSPAPPPPPDAGSLPEDDQQADGLSLRERLEQHRAEPTCAACHARMDPYGLALEAFDGIGRLRADVDSSAVLPGGLEVTGPAELKEALLASPHRFVRAFVDHLFVYAVGRAPGLEDHEVLEQIVLGSAERGYPMRELILGVASTPAFLPPAFCGEEPR